MSVMIANSYIGMVQPEVPRLIVSRARRYRVGRDEIDDLQQHIVPLLAGFRFDPARANGATPATAMTGVIDRQIKAYLRAKRRYQHRVGRLQAITDDANRHSDRTQVNPHNPVDLRMDLDEAMSRLSLRDRQVCQGLSQGMSIRRIAGRLCCSGDTISRAVIRIRRLFDAAGVGAWVEPDSPGMTNARARRDC